MSQSQFQSISLSNQLVSKESQKPRLLFVNDDEFLSQGYKAQLQPFFRIHFAQNGLKATEMVSRHSNDYYDIILMDINMPVLDGFQAIAIILKQFQKLSGGFNSSPLKRTSKMGRIQFTPIRSRYSDIIKMLQKFAEAQSLPLIYALTADESIEML